MNASFVFPFIFNALWQSALFGVGSWAVIKFLKINNASARCLLWSAAFFLSSAVPLAAVTVRTDVEVIVAPSPVEAIALAASAPTQSMERSAPAASAAFTAVNRQLSGLLLLIWIGGAAWRTIHLVRDNLKVAQLRWNSAPLHGDELMLPARVSLRMHPDICVPVATGIVHPAIILPKESADDLSAAAAKSAIAHELAHIRRGDIAFAFFESAALVVYWWNPILQKIRAEILENREMACDDRAAAAIADPRTYALSLVDFAERALRFRAQARNVAALAASGGDPSGLKRRIARLVSDDYAGLIQASTPRLLLAGAVIASTSVVAAAAAPRIVVHPSAVSESVGAAYDQPEATTQSEQLGRLLVAAIADRNWAGADTLLAAGADVNAAVPGDGTPLIAAVNAGSTRYARKLIELGADVDAEIIHDETALISAVRRRDAAMVRLLIDANADVNKSSTTENGEVRSPLGEARALGASNIERMLREAGATAY